MQQDMNIGGFDQNALGKMVNLRNPVILLKYLFLAIYCPGCPQFENTRRKRRMVTIFVPKKYPMKVSGGKSQAKCV